MRFEVSIEWGTYWPHRRGPMGPILQGVKWSPLKHGFENLPAIQTALLPNQAKKCGAPGGWPSGGVHTFRAESATG